MKLYGNLLRVIYALNRYPNKSGSELCEITGLKSSTFTTIKTRCQDMGFISLVRIPNPNVIGMKIRFIEYGMLKKGLSIDDAYKLVRENAMKHGIVFSFISDGLSYYIQSLTPSYTAMKSFLEGLSIGRCRLKFGCRGNSVWHAFELGSDKLKNLYDQSKLLEEYAGLELDFKIPEEITPTEREGITSMWISDSIRRIVMYLIELPPRKDNEIASALGISRQIVGRVRLELERNGQLIKAYTINTKLLGYNIRSFFTITHSSDCSEPNSRELNSFLSKKRPQYWLTNGHFSTFQYDFLDTSSLKQFINELHLRGAGAVEKIESISLSLKSAIEIVQETPVRLSNDPSHPGVKIVNHFPGPVIG